MRMRERERGAKGEREGARQRRERSGGDFLCRRRELIRASGGKGF